MFKFKFKKTAAITVLFVALSAGAVVNSPLAYSADVVPTAFLMIDNLTVDMDNNGFRDDSTAYDVRVVNLTSGVVVTDAVGRTGGQESVSESVMAYVAQTPTYEFTVTTAGESYSFTTSASDFTTDHASRTLTLDTVLTPAGFTHTSMTK